jgi:hypothetical protein
MKDITIFFSNNLFTSLKQQVEIDMTF